MTAISQVAVVLRRKGKVLLLRRPPEGLWGGLFELCAGDLLTGESIPGAAARVVEERTGLHISPTAFTPLSPPADCFEHVLSHRRITFHGLCAEAPEGAVRRSFHDAHQWITPGAAVSSLGVSRATVQLLDGLGAPTTSTQRERSSRRG